MAIEAATRFRKLTETHTLQQAAQQLLEEIGVVLTVEGSVPAEGPLLIALNHPGGIDSLVVLAAIARPDVYLVGLATFQNVGGEISQRLLPIFRAKRFRDHLLALLAPTFLTHVVENENQRTALNKASIERAAELVAAGHAVVIFPTGSGGRQPTVGSWKKGVGFLAQQIDNPDTQVAFGHLKNTRKKDLARFVNLRVTRYFLPRKNVTLRWAPPQSLTDITGQAKYAQQATQLLESAYVASFALDGSA